MPGTNELSDQYSAIPFTLNHYAFIKELSKSAFGHALNYKGFLKRFDTLELGCEVVGFIAMHKETNSPAAYYGVFPQKLLLANKIILAAQSGDTMTHADHRKRGLFVWLAKLTFENCREKGIQIVFGLPNNKSYPGLVNRLNWLHLDDISSYDLKLKRKTIPAAKLFLKTGLFTLYLKLAKAFLSKLIIENTDKFSNSFETDYSKVVRDKYTLHYKEGNDKTFIKINNLILWIKFSDVLWIGDFNNYDLVDEKAISKLRKIATYLGYNTIRFNFNNSLKPPLFLSHFKKHNQEASCFFYINDEYRGTNLLLTAADFDTW